MVAHTVESEERSVRCRRPWTRPTGRCSTALQRDARVSYRELSEQVNLSPPAVADRVRRMEEAGVLLGYHAHLDPARARVDDRGDRHDVVPRQPVRAPRSGRHRLARDRRHRPRHGRRLLVPARPHADDGPLRVGDRPVGDVRPPVELDGPVELAALEAPRRAARGRSLPGAMAGDVRAPCGGCEEHPDVGLGPRLVDAEAGEHAACRVRARGGRAGCARCRCSCGPSAAPRGTSARAPCGPAGS